MKYIWNCIWTLGFTLFVGVSGADVPAQQRAEVAHLLDFVEQSSCRIDRNGKIYPASKAVSHIRKKYAYFEDDIQSTEDFIELSASKSTMSGRYYLVTCGDDEPIRTRQWLLQELDFYRRQQ